MASSLLNFSRPITIFHAQSGSRNLKLFEGLKHGGNLGLPSRSLRESFKLIEKRGTCFSIPTNGSIIKSVLVSDNQLEVLHPQLSEGFSTITDAIEDIRQGKMVLVVDDEDRENEGDFIMAASKATPEAMAFIVKHGTGIICVSMKEDLKRLHLPLMVNEKDNEEKLCVAFTISVDAKDGTTTGVSASDRAITILKLASKESKPEDFVRPGHIFPLQYREGGVLKRPGHTEASLDLTLLAGLEPAAVLCEVVDDDGSMARLPKLMELAKKENIKLISIADLVRYIKRQEGIVGGFSSAPN